MNPFSKEKHKEIVDELILVCNDCGDCDNYSSGTSPCESINIKAATLVAEAVKEEIVDFGYWLVNAPKKEKFTREWIAEKYEQFKEEKIRTEIETEAYKDTEWENSLDYHLLMRGR